MTIEPQAASYRAAPEILSLGGEIGDPVQAARFPKLALRFRNDRWAQTIGLADLSDEQWLAHFGGFAPLADNLPDPLALRYHGHQFRTYNPDIGDGRGFLFAQVRDHRDRLLDLGTKGSGQTPYSRDGDGRLTLKGAVREILATEMLEALGVDTSRTLSVIETGEELWRGDEPSPTRSAVLVRLSHSHVRFGTFQRVAFERNEALMHRLVRYCLDHFYNGASSEMPAALLLHKAVERHAVLAASYMVAGFVHGVLNTDNMNITGESFDYGPWRFTEHWQPDFTAAYFDHAGLYAFGRQPESLHWNLGQLAVALRLICPAEPLIEALERFGPLYQAALADQFCWRLGVVSQGFDNDKTLIEAAERMMVEERVPVDRFYFDWMGGCAADHPNTRETTVAFTALYKAYAPGRSRDHDYWSDATPQSMLIEEVETIWQAIAEADNWGPLTDKIAAVRRMGAALRS